MNAEILQKCPTSKFEQLAHEVINRFCGKVGSFYENFSDIWSLEEYWTICDEIKNICKEYAHAATSKDATMELLRKEIPKNYKEIIASILCIRRLEILAEIDSRITEMSSSSLKDIDWQVKLALDSDKLSGLKTTFTNLELHVKERDFNRTITVEMDKNELQKVVASLENCQRVLQQYK